MEGGVFEGDSLGRTKGEEEAVKISFFEEVGGGG